MIILNKNFFCRICNLIILSILFKEKSCIVVNEDLLKIIVVLIVIMKSTVKFIYDFFCF